MAASAIAAGRADVRVGEEAMEDAGQVQAGQHAGDLVGGEDVGGDEAAEGGAEALPSGWG